MVTFDSHHLDVHCTNVVKVGESTRGSLVSGRIPGVDKDVSRIIYGTLFLHTFASDEEAFALLDSVWQTGCNTIDCAFI